MMTMTQELDDALCAWRDANRAYMSTEYRSAEARNCWYAMNDAAAVVFQTLDAMDGSAAQAERTP